MTQTLRRFALTAAALLIGTGCAGAKAHQKDTPMTTAPHKQGHIEANGLRYYYEVHGQGAPLLLLHGGLGSIDMFAPILPRLAQHRTVIGVDLQGHGRTALGDRELDLPAMGRDLAVILSELGHEQVDVLGYSFGGGAALQLAAQHPERVRRLVLVSAGFKRDGFFPEILEQQKQVGAGAAEFMKETPMYKGYVAVAPHPEDFPRLLDQIGRYMAKPFDATAEVKRLTMPVMIIFGDSDMYRPEHVVEFYKLLGGGLRDAGWTRQHQSKNRLAILPDHTHYDIFMSPRMVDTALPFLDGESAAQQWTGEARP